MNMMGFFVQQREFVGSNLGSEPKDKHLDRDIPMVHTRVFLSARTCKQAILDVSKIGILILT